MLEGLMPCKNNNRLLVDEEICLITQPVVSLKLGKSSAIFLQQLHYWMTSRGEVGVTVDGQRWVYNSYKSWVGNIRIFSESTIRRAVRKLEDLGIVLTKNMNHKKSDHTKWYTINYDKLKEFIPDFSMKNPSLKRLSKKDVSLFKMNRPSVQNEQIIYNEPENTSETITIFSEEKLGFDLKNVSQQVNVVSRGREKKVFDKNSKGSVSSIQQPSTQNTTASDLLEIWNQTVSRQQGEGETFIQLTKKRAQHLVAAFKYRFGSNFDKWKEFCHQITTSDFLMGKVKSTFRASLDWVLKFDILQRIVEGDFGVQKNLFVNQKDSSWQEETVSQEIKASLESKHVQGFRLSVLRALGVKAYQSWFAQMSIREEGMDLVLTASSRFVRDYIQTHYGNKLLSLTSHRLNLS
jgi:hypothetical protein